MARKKEKAPAAERALVMRGGARYPVTREDGKWWICGAVRFRKGNPAIVAVEAEIPPTTAPEDTEE